RLRRRPRSHLDVDRRGRAASRTPSVSPRLARRGARVMSDHRRPFGSRRVQPNPRRAATPLQRAHGAFLSALAVAQAELTPREFAVWLELVTIRVAAENGRQLDRETAP